MLKDRYENTLSTGSSAARDAYVDGVDRFLSAAPGAGMPLPRRSLKIQALPWPMSGWPGTIN